MKTLPILCKLTFPHLPAAFVYANISHRNWFDDQHASVNLQSESEIVVSHLLFAQKFSVLIVRIVWEIPVRHSTRENTLNFYTSHELCAYVSGVGGSLDDVAVDEFDRLPSFFCVVDWESVGGWWWSVRVVRRWVDVEKFIKPIDFIYKSKLWNLKSLKSFVICLIIFHRISKYIECYQFIVDNPDLLLKLSSALVSSECVQNCVRCVC